MTGKELIAWIRENKAENLQMLVIDDGYAVFMARPEVREADELKRVYVSTGWLRKGEKAVVL